jgi:hypothetical protein
VTLATREDQATARARAGRIRQGIHNYLTTLAEISKAYADRDWVALGYPDWQAYVDEEFGADRLRLPAEHRQKAVVELRLAGMSQRAIGAALGVDHKTVAGDLRSGGEFSPPADVQGADGKTYAATRPAPEPELEDQPLPLGDLTAAITAAIEGTVERVTTTTEPRWSEDEQRLRESVLASETVVASLRGTQHANLLRWAEDNGLFVRIDRRTEWGNPFELPADGDRDTVIASYAVHYLPFKPSLLGKLETLRGKVLACWCAPEACHGDILVELLEQP